MPTKDFLVMYIRICGGSGGGGDGSMCALLGANLISDVHT